MSNAINDVFTENLYDRLADLLPRITPMSATEVTNLIEEGDLESANYLLDVLEAKYNDDL